MLFNPRRLLWALVLSFALSLAVVSATGESKEPTCLPKDKVNGKCPSPPGPSKRAALERKQAVVRKALEKKAEGLCPGGLVACRVKGTEDGWEVGTPLCSITSR